MLSKTIKLLKVKGNCCGKTLNVCKGIEGDLKRQLSI